MTTEPIETRKTKWVTGRDTGISSMAIYAVMSGTKPDDTYCHPHDGDDLGRCIRLLDLIPEWRPRINEMAAVSKEWRALVTHWDKLERLWRTGDMKAVYDSIQKIVRPIEDKRKNIVRFGAGATIRFGRTP